MKIMEINEPKDCVVSFVFCILFTFNQRIFYTKKELNRIHLIIIIIILITLCALLQHYEFRVGLLYPLIPVGFVTIASGINSFTAIDSTLEIILSVAVISFAITLVRDFIYLKHLRPYFVAVRLLATGILLILFGGTAYFLFKSKDKHLIQKFSTFKFLHYIFLRYFFYGFTTTFYRTIWLAVELIYDTIIFLSKIVYQDIYDLFPT